MNLIYSRSDVSHCLWAWFQSPLAKIMACEFKINFLTSKVILWETTRKRSIDKVKCCICTYKVLYAIKLKCSEQTCTVVNVWTCFVLHRGLFFPEILRCYAAKTLLEKIIQLMQIVNYTTWIISFSTEKEDSHKVSIILLFVVNFYVALSLSQQQM